LKRSTIFSELCKRRVFKRKFFTISGSLFIRKANALGTKSRTKTCHCMDKTNIDYLSKSNKIKNKKCKRTMTTKYETRGVTLPMIIKLRKFHKLTSYNTGPRYTP
jgi:hypothetical protein